VLIGDGESPLDPGAIAGADRPRLEQRDRPPALREMVGGGDADDPATEHGDIDVDVRRQRRMGLAAGVDQPRRAECVA
jgi:hypothetical protein